MPAEPVESAESAEPVEPDTRASDKAAPRTSESGTAESGTAESATADSAKGESAGKAAKPAWQGRAGVRPAMIDEHDPAADWAAPRAPGRAWWLPVVLGIVALVVIVGVVYVVVARSTQHDDAPPVAAPSSTSPSASLSATANAYQPTNPVSVPSSSALSLPSGPSSMPVLPTLITPTGLVQVPDVTQLFVPDAQNELSAFGLESTLKAEVTTTYMPNVVIAMDPPAGTSVPAGKVITLTYAVPPTPSASAASPSGSPTP